MRRGAATPLLGSALSRHGQRPPDLTVDPVEHGLVFVGLTGMDDPPRAEAKEAVAKWRAAGIRPVTLPLQSGRRPRRMPLLFPITPCFTARAGKLPTARSYS